MPPSVLIALAAAAAAAVDLSARQFTSGIDLVEVYATVTDRSGELVTTLSKDDFEVFDEGERQTVSVFAIGEVPLALAVAVDRSFSMKAGRRLDDAKAAVAALIQGLNADDRVLLLAVGSEVEEVSGLSADRGPLRRALSSLDAWGTTSLHDAIVAGIDRIQPHGGRRALVILSDGDDRYSRTSAADTLARARASDVLVYPIAVGQKRPPLFAELAVATGGRSMHVTEGRRLAPALAAIAAELRAQYLLGYTPARTTPGGVDGWRSIRVSVSRPDLRVRARDGYFAKGRR